MGSIGFARTAGCLLLIAACKKTEPPPPPPPPAGIEGASCSSRSPCNAGLECTPRTFRCERPDHPELVAARQAVVEAERRYLEQSGVEPPAHAERPTPAPAPPAAGTVRVVTVSSGGKGSWVFAACRADERLVSGGCKLNTPTITVIDGFPSDHATADTIGARWNCGRRGGGDLDLEAYALCQRL